MVKNSQLLFEKVTSVPIYPIKRTKKEEYYQIIINKPKMDFVASDLVELSSKIKYLIEEHPNLNKKLYINLSFIKIKDKPTVVVLEKLIYSLINETEFKVYLNIIFDKQFTLNSYIYYSPLFTSIKEDKQIDVDDFNNKMTKFNQNQPINLNYLRVNFKNADELRLSKFSQDVGTTLTNLGFDDNVVFSIRDIFAELNINMLEHGKANFSSILQVDNTYLDNEKKGHLISITVFNTSENKLYTPLKNIVNNKLLLDSQAKLYKALNYHEHYFDDNYILEDFLMISTFQRNISSRINHGYNSGTGLTTVVNSLLENIGDVEDKYHYSYVLSGDRVLYFKSNRIKESKIDDEYQIGFNNSGKYINDLPDENIKDKTSYYYNGTLFYMRIFIENKGDT